MKKVEITGEMITRALCAFRAAPIGNAAAAVQKALEAALNPPAAEPVTITNEMVQAGTEAANEWFNAHGLSHVDQFRMIYRAMRRLEPKQESTVSVHPTCAANGCLCVPVTSRGCLWRGQKNGWSRLTRDERSGVDRREQDLKHLLNADRRCKNRCDRRKGEK